MPRKSHVRLVLAAALLLAGPEGMRVASSSDDAIVGLGQALFFDARLSRDGTVSCANCHVPERLFSDGRSRSLGASGRSGTRNAPSLLAVNAYSMFNWEGRSNRLEDQVIQPFVTPVEHGLESHESLVDVLRRDEQTVERFTSAFGSMEPAVTVDKVATALAGYVRTLGRSRSRLERFLFDGDREALSAGAQRGLALFNGAAGCGQCHRIEAEAAPLTDNRFHSVGIGLTQTMSGLPRAIHTLEAVPRADAGRHVLADADIAALGRYVVTRMPEDIGRFRTPSLRGVARTAPYFHDGSVAMLGEAIAIELYYRGSSDRSAALSLDEQIDLLAFLESLDD